MYIAPKYTIDIQVCTTHIHKQYTVYTTNIHNKYTCT